MRFIIFILCISTLFANEDELFFSYTYKKVKSEAVLVKMVDGVKKEIKIPSGTVIIFPDDWKTHEEEVGLLITKYKLAKENSLSNSIKLQLYEQERKQLARLKEEEEKLIKMRDDLNRREVFLKDRMIDSLRKENRAIVWKGRLKDTLFTILAIAKSVN